MVWARPRSLAATEGISVDFSSSGYSDVSVPPVRSAPGAVTGIAPRRVSPFGHPWITGCVPLPTAYRSLPRPSSPPCAQASPTGLLSLDHINRQAQHAQESLHSDSTYVRSVQSPSRRSTSATTHVVAASPDENSLPTRPTALQRSTAPRSITCQSAPRRSELARERRGELTILLG